MVHLCTHRYYKCLWRRTKGVCKCIFILLPLLNYRNYLDQGLNKLLATPVWLRNEWVWSKVEIGLPLHPVQYGQAGFSLLFCSRQGRWGKHKSFSLQYWHILPNCWWVLSILPRQWQEGQHQLSLSKFAEASGFLWEEKVRHLGAFLEPKHFLQSLTKKQQVWCSMGKSYGKRTSCQCYDSLKGVWWGFKPSMKSNQVSLFP